VRHSESGAPYLISQHVAPHVHVINAGDGRHAHPTQGLLDIRNALVARSRLSGLSKASDGGVEVRLRDCTEHLPVSRSHLASIRRLLLNGFHGVSHGPDFPLDDSMLAHVTVELPIEIRDRLTRASERTGKNVAGIVERALREELERLEREGI
jgi:hypothetical protein